MGSDLYVSIEVRHPNTPHRDPKTWSELWEGPSQGLARGIVVEAFGHAPDDVTVARKNVWRADADGYLTRAEWVKRAEHPECPWRLDEPYWVRCIPGQEFVAIVHEKRWQKLQDGDFKDTECSPELRCFAVMVDGLMAEGLDVRVWCWHSQ